MLSKSVSARIAERTAWHVRHDALTILRIRSFRLTPRFAVRLGSYRAGPRDPRICGHTHALMGMTELWPGWLLFLTSGSPVVSSFRLNRRDEPRVPSVTRCSMPAEYSPSLPEVESGAGAASPFGRL